MACQKALVIKTFGGLALPGRKALLKSDMEYKVVLIDATENPIERLKKSKGDTIQGRKKDILSRHKL